MKKLIFLIMAVATGFVSCLKTPDLSQLSGEFVVSTNLDKNAQFSNYKTYYVSDTVVNIGGTDKDTIITGDNALQLVNAVKTNMNARGYTFKQLSGLSHPDLGIRIGIIKILNVEVFYPGWWWGYPGWGYPWYPYYPYYPYYPFATVYTYNTGTVLVDAYDLKNASANHQLDVVWNCTGFGALGSGTSGNVTRGVNSINQGFIQSPYFTTK